jgi:hypothetical protein
MRDDDSATGRKTGPAKTEPATTPSLEPPAEQCDWCGSTDLWWRNCKLLCRNCSAIVKSCADL